MHTVPPTKAAAILACTLIVAGTVLLLSAIDLVLPSVPDMPEIFGTTIAHSQLVIAAFVGGSTIGMLIYGSLAAHYGRRRLFIASLATYIVFTVLAIFSPDIWSLVVLRFLQGAAASGTAALAPGLIRSLFSELGAMKALSAMGSIEALVPGLAPLAGAWLHVHYGWTASFTVTAALVTFICLIIVIRPRLIPSIGTSHNKAAGGYLKLLKSPTYLRYAMGHACVLGGLLCFVFSAPAIIIETMNGEIHDFIYMQMTGVTCFIITANISGNLVKRYGVEPIIMAGTLIACMGVLVLLFYSLIGPNKPEHLLFMFWILNTGLGLRGGPGFVQALSASNGDDDRASAILLVAVTGFAAIATALVAPFIQYGLIALSITTCIIVLPSVFLMLFIKPLGYTAPTLGE
ncbi:MFS transporter [Kordiimonas pumila]|uniref:MFS transporter n=1 Tax=Kordiimonas pumila TaxID=2161677 RepID=A0ABV7D6C6_9PROT|nr:MFS transporter [Kordiimonas pumila]